MSNNFMWNCSSINHLQLSLFFGYKTSLSSASKRWQLCISLSLRPSVPLSVCRPGRVAGHDCRLSGSRSIAANLQLAKGLHKLAIITATVGLAAAAGEAAREDVAAAAAASVAVAVAGSVPGVAERVAWPLIVAWTALLDRLRVTVSIAPLCQPTGRSIERPTEATHRASPPCDQLKCSQCQALAVDRLNELPHRMRVVPQRAFHSIAFRYVSFHIVSIDKIVWLGLRSHGIYELHFIVLHSIPYRSVPCRSIPIRLRWQIVDWRNPLARAA